MNPKRFRLVQAVAEHSSSLDRIRNVLLGLDEAFCAASFGLPTFSGDPQIDVGI
jgi:hypothetical protein